ncbi:hypothetical protein GALL_518560 [mine drainage metagenome]|uniref:Uncharacterized protein n=1 Tax=mine drainage metagenome TaxID=410659 RepID=A0A1J5P5U6_9ZZZZ
MLVGAQLHAHHVAARARLAHRQRADMLAAEQPGQVLFLLRCAAVAADLVDAQVGMRAVAQAHRGAGARDLLHRHHVRHVAHAGAAVGLGHGHAEQAQVAELAPQVHRELVGAVDLGGARCDLLVRKVAHGLAQGSDVLAELEVQSGQLHGVSSVAPFVIRCRVFSSAWAPAQWSAASPRRRSRCRLRHGAPPRRWSRSAACPPAPPARGRATRRR